MTTNTTTATPTNRLVTKSQLADALRVSTRTIDRWRSIGIDMGEVRTPGYPRFDLHRVLDLIGTGRLDRKTGRSRR